MEVWLVQVDDLVLGAEGHRVVVRNGSLLVTRETELFRLVRTVELGSDLHKISRSLAISLEELRLCLPGPQVCMASRR